MAVGPYLGVLMTPLAFLIELFGAVGLLFYATRLEQNREREDAPRIITPYTIPTKPKWHWFWLKLAGVVAAVVVTGAISLGAWLKLHEAPPPSIPNSPPVPSVTRAAPRTTTNSNKKQTSAKTMEPKSLPAKAPETPTAAQSQVTPAGSSEATKPGQVRVTNLVEEGAKNRAFIDANRIDATSKPEGTAFVVILVSGLTREKGTPNLQTIQSVVDAVTSSPGVRVFFADQGYRLSRGLVTTQFAGCGGSLRAIDGAPGEILVYDAHFLDLAQRLRSRLNGLVNMREATKAIVNPGALYQDFWKASGVDIEIFL